MNPNKKTLNPQYNSPWILCPSKSFPGKFYYFNGSTGETAWSINEPDNKNPKKSTIHKVTDKTHTYPEPFGPPADESTNTTTSYSILKKDLINNMDCNRSNRFSSSMVCNKGSFCTGGNFSNGHSFSSGTSNEPNINFGTNMKYGTNLRHPINSCGNLKYGTNMDQGQHLNLHMGMQLHNSITASPTFGQAVFPRYVTNDMSTKVIWALTPMLVPEKVIPTQLDQVTQYEHQSDLEPVRLMQFENFKVKPQENPFRLKKFHTSSPIKHLEAETQTFDLTEAKIFTSKSSKVTQTFDKKSTKDDACQTFVPRRIRTQSETEPPKFTLQSSKLVDKLTSTDIENETLSAPSKIDNYMTKLAFLDKNDLRYKLVARQKSVDLDTVESKDTAKLPTKPSHEIAPKKRVTFDLGDQNSSNGDDHENEIQSPSSLDSELLEQHQPMDSVWYAVVDAAVLLTELECIEEFVLSDKNCRLLIPYTVNLQVETLSRGVCTGRQNIITARQIVRKLATPQPHIIVQSKPDNKNSDEVDALECCWRLIQEKCHVILITNNKNLSSKAQEIGLECHTIDKIKEIINPAPQVDLKKVKILVDNSEKRCGNLFQQSIKELNTLHLPQTEFPVHSVRRTLFDKTHSGNNVFTVENKDKLINVTNTFEALKKISYTHVNDIELDIKKLAISEYSHVANEHVLNNVEMINDVQNRVNTDAFQIKNRNDNVKVSGITKLNSVFDIDDELKRYEVKNVEMENRIKSRRDEWVCRLTQTMEGVLTDILLKENVRPKKILPPWNLHEAIQILGDKFKSLPKTKIITTQFTMHLFNCSSNAGKLNINIHPKDFMKMVGYSMILIQNLKETLDYIELNEADNLLSELIKHIEDSNTDVDLTLDKVITPIINRTDMEFETKIPVGYKKKQFDVLEYLKKHYPAMEAYEFEKPEPKVLRTVGKDLSTLKINNCKSITIENVNLPVEVNAVVAESKGIRNVKVIDFEEKLMNLDDLDYEESLSTISFEDEENYKSDETERDIEDKNGRMDDKLSNLQDCVAMESVSSDFNECIHAYPLMKAFLGRMKRTFLLIYNFINESMEDYQRDMPDDKKSDVNLKMNMAHKYILKLVERLKIIIARECSEGTTLKDLLIQAGDFVDNDRAMADYGQVVTKYLEQAQVLEEALTLMLTLVNEKSIMDPMSNGIAYHGTFTAVTGQSASRNDKMAIQLTNQFQIYFLAVVVKSTMSASAERAIDGLVY